MLFHYHCLLKKCGKIFYHILLKCMSLKITSFHNALLVIKTLFRKKGQRNYVLLRCSMAIPYVYSVRLSKQVFGFTTSLLLQKRIITEKHRCGTLLRKVVLLGDERGWRSQDKQYKEREREGEWGREEKFRYGDWSLLTTCLLKLGCIQK